MSLRLQNHSLPPDLSTDSLKVAELTTPLPPAPKTVFSARLSQTPELPGQSCREATQAGLRKISPPGAVSATRTAWREEGTGKRGTHCSLLPFSELKRKSDRLLLRHDTVSPFAPQLTSVTLSIGELGSD
jgi:hypothetical protein